MSRARAYVSANAERRRGILGFFRSKAMNLNHVYRQVRTALKRGILVRPDTCSKCGCKPGRAADGRSKIHAHHPDHGKPLEIEWLCAKCHRKETPMPFGEKNGAARLSREMVAQAKAMHAAGSSYAEIAEKFGVNRTTTRRAIVGVHWSEA